MELAVKQNEEIFKNFSEDILYLKKNKFHMKNQNIMKKKRKK